MSSKQLLKKQMTIFMIVITTMLALVVPVKSLASEQEMVITDKQVDSFNQNEKLVESLNKPYDTYYYTDDIKYIFKGLPVDFVSDSEFISGQKKVNLNNRQTTVAVETKDKTTSISLSGLVAPVGPVAGSWNPDFGGVTEVVYKTDIPGMEEVRSGQLNKPLVFNDLADGTYHLTSGSIFEKANEWSPGLDFGSGVVSERYFGVLPDITFTIGAPSENGDGENEGLTGEYIGFKPEVKIYDGFENDIWLQYQQKNLKVGDTADLRPWRVPQIVSDVIANDVARPEFNFEVISGDSVSLSEAKSSDKTVVKAEKPGTSVVKVTYNGMSYASMFFDASSPENTAYAIYTVGQDGNIDLTVNDELKNWQHYNTIYYTEGETTPFDFVAKAPENTQVKAFLNGVEINGDNGKYTAQLENRNNIISVEATDENGKMTSIQRVVAARFIEINQKNKTQEGQEFSAGDTVNVSFRGIKMPVHKLAAIYNPTFYNPTWGDPGTYVTYKNDVLGDFKGRAGQWDLATKNSFDVDLKDSGDYLFTSPDGIFTSWWGSPLGSDLDASGNEGQDVGTIWPTFEGNFSKMPDFTISVAGQTQIESIKLDQEKLELNAGDTKQLTVAVVPESATSRVIWSSSDESIATVSETGLIETFKQGTTIITASIGDIKAEMSLTVVGNLVIPVTDIKLQFEQLGFEAGGTKQLEYSVVPANATDQTPTFTSDNEKIAVVTPDGLLIGTGIGMTKIHIQIGDIKKTWEVSFYLPQSIEKVFSAIDKIPAVDELTIEDKPVVEKARKAYDGLNENEQTVVKNEGKLAILEAAEQRLTELENGEPTDPKPENKDFINLTVERFTIGQGFFQEPIRVPVTKGEKVSEVVDRFMKDNGHDYSHSGTLQENYYLVEIDNADTGKVKVPSYIPDYLYGPTTEEAIENGNNYAPSLGEFSYNQGAGWIYFLNNEAPNVGMADKTVENDDVIRLQFTLVWGADLGNSNATQARSAMPKAMKLDDQLVFSNKDAAIKELATFNSSSDKDEKLKDEKVKKAYEELSNGVEEALIPQKELDEKVTDFEKELEKDPAVSLAEYKEEKIKELNEYKDLKDYRKAEQEAIKNIINEAAASIEKAETTQAVDSLVTDAKEKLDQVKTDAQLTAQEEADQKELKEYQDKAVNEVNDFVKDEDYRKAEQKEVALIKSNAKHDIEKASTKALVDDIVSSAKEELSQVKTKAQWEIEEAGEADKEKLLKEYKEKSIAELDAYVNKDDYRKKEAKEIDKLMAQAKKDINQATDTKQVDMIVTNTKEQLDKVETDAQLTAKEEAEQAEKDLAKRKKEAIKEVSEYKDLKDYRKAEQAEIKAINEQATKDIEKAVTIDEVEQIVITAKADLDLIKTDAELSAEETPVTPSELESYKQDSIKTLQDYLDLDDYETDQQTEIEDLLKQAQDDINKASTTAEVDNIVNETKANLDLVKTAKDIEAQKVLDKYKQEELTKFNKSIVLTDYREKEQAKVKAIQEETEKAVKEAEDQAAVDSIIENAQVRLNDVKTDKELTQEEQDIKDKELIAKKLQAIDEMVAYKKLSDYDAAGQRDIQMILEKAIKEVNDAKTSEEVDAIVVSTKAALDKVTPISGVKPDEAKKLKENTKLTTDLVAGVKQVSGVTLPNTLVSYEVISKNSELSKEAELAETVVSDDNGKFTLMIKENLVKGDDVIFTFAKGDDTYTLTETVKAKEEPKDPKDPGKGSGGTTPPNKDGSNNSGNGSKGNYSSGSNNSTNNASDNLPKTGETKLALTWIGVIVVGSGAGLYVFNKRKTAE